MVSVWFRLLIEESVQSRRQYKRDHKYVPLLLMARERTTFGDLGGGIKRPWEKDGGTRTWKLFKRWSSSSPFLALLPSWLPSPMRTMGPPRYTSRTSTSYGLKYFLIHLMPLCCSGDEGGRGRWRTLLWRTRGGSWLHGERKTTSCCNADLSSAKGWHWVRRQAEHGPDDLHGRRRWGGN